LGESLLCFQQRITTFPAKGHQTHADSGHKPLSTDATIFLGFAFVVLFGLGWSMFLSYGERTENLILTIHLPQFWQKRLCIVRAAPRQNAKFVNRIWIGWIFIRKNKERESQ